MRYPEEAAEDDVTPEDGCCFDGRNDERDQACHRDAVRRRPFRDDVNGARQQAGEQCGGCAEPPWMAALRASDRRVGRERASNGALGKLRCRADDRRGRDEPDDGECGVSNVVQGVRPGRLAAVSLERAQAALRDEHLRYGAGSRRQQGGRAPSGLADVQCDALTEMESSDPARYVFERPGGPVVGGETRWRPCIASCAGSHKTCVADHSASRE
jgi:hypothetical protein